ncbi:sn-glycerol 3-phosphate transport system permease protein [Paenibacillus sp. 1_12]|nr:sn-glycerol 3-phosphate transport system permease protein [Paenibacillus sp. 1_12]
MTFASKHLWSLLSTLLKLLLLIIFVFPFFWMISTSLQTIQETLTFPPTLIPASPQWNNFVVAMSSGPFLTYAQNSIVVTLSIIILQFGVMIPAAYAFAKYSFAGKKILFGMVLLAFMIPGQVTFIPVYLMLADWGLIKTLWPQSFRLCQTHSASSFYANISCRFQKKLLKRPNWTMPVSSK